MNADKDLRIYIAERKMERKKKERRNERKKNEMEELYNIMQLLPRMVGINFVFSCSCFGRAGITFKLRRRKIDR